MSWAFLAVSIVGAWFTANALWPSRRWQLLGLSFFAGWLTGELAMWHVAWQAAATLIFVSWGALDQRAGVVGLAITFVSWAGLFWMIAVSFRSRGVVETALREALGEHYEREIVPGRAANLANRIIRRQLLLPLLLRDRRVERIGDIAYTPGGGRRQHLDVYRPRGPLEQAPVLLQIHGGGWVIGDKRQQGLPLMMHLATEGWVCVAINYRRSPQVRFPDHLVDCKRALRWVKEHIAEYGGDPDFVVVTGGSAGGHLSALVALTANDARFQPGFEQADTSVSACVPFYGVYDLAEVFAFTGRGEEIANAYARGVMGASPEEDPAGYQLASPLTHVRPDAPPFFVIHGTHDNLVPVTQARRLVAALRAVSRAPVAYAEIPGASHAFEIFHSVRAGNAVNGVDRFLAWVYSAYETVTGRGDAAHPAAAARSHRFAKHVR